VFELANEGLGVYKRDASNDVLHRDEFTCGGSRRGAGASVPSYAGNFNAGAGVAGGDLDGAEPDLERAKAIRKRNVLVATEDQPAGVDTRDDAAQRDSRRCANPWVYCVSDCFAAVGGGRNGSVDCSAGGVDCGLPDCDDCGVCDSDAAVFGTARFEGDVARADGGERALQFRGDDSKLCDFICGTRFFDSGVIELGRSWVGIGGGLFVFFRDHAVYDRVRRHGADWRGADDCLFAGGGRSISFDFVGREVY